MAGWSGWLVAWLWTEVNKHAKKLGQYPASLLVDNPYYYTASFVSGQEELLRAHAPAHAMFEYCKRK